MVKVFKNSPYSLLPQSPVSEGFDEVWISLHCLQIFSYKHIKNENLPPEKGLSPKMSLFAVTIFRTWLYPGCTRISFTHTFLSSEVARLRVAWGRIKPGLQLPSAEVLSLGYSLPTLWLLSSSPLSLVKDLSPTEGVV